MLSQEKGCQLLFGLSTKDFAVQIRVEFFPKSAGLISKFHLVKRKGQYY